MFKKYLGWFLVVIGIAAPIVAGASSFTGSDASGIEAGIILKSLIATFIAVPYGISLIRQSNANIS